MNPKAVICEKNLTLPEWPILVEEIGNQSDQFFADTVFANAVVGKVLAQQFLFELSRNGNDSQTTISICQSDADMAKNMPAYLPCQIFVAAILIGVQCNAAENIFEGLQTYALLKQIAKDLQ